MNSFSAGGISFKTMFQPAPATRFNLVEIAYPWQPILKFRLFLGAWLAGCTKDC